MLELKFVPAVLLHCAWGPDAPAPPAAAPAPGDPGTTSSSTSSSGSGSAVGWYLHDALLSQAASKHDGAAAAAAAMFPTGAALILAPGGGDGPGEGLVAEGTESGGGEPAPAATGKPKWFKL